MWGSDSASFVPFRPNLATTVELSRALNLTDEGLATVPTIAYAKLPTCHHRPGPQHVPRRLDPTRTAHGGRTPAKPAIPSAPVTSGSNQPLNPLATVSPTECMYAHSVTGVDPGHPTLSLFAYTQTA